MKRRRAIARVKLKENKNLEKWKQSKIPTFVTEISPLLKQLCKWQKKRLVFNYCSTWSFLFGNAKPKKTCYLTDDCLLSTYDVVTTSLSGVVETLPQRCCQVTQTLTIKFIGHFITDNSNILPVIETWQAYTVALKAHRVFLKERYIYS